MSETIYPYPHIVAVAGHRHHPGQPDLHADAPRSRSPGPAQYLTLYFFRLYFSFLVPNFFFRSCAPGRRVVLVANLPADITAEQLRADFAVLGAIVHVDASLQQRLIITSIYYTPVCFCSMRSTLFHIISAGVIFI